MKPINFDETPTPAGWVRGREDGELAPYIEHISSMRNGTSTIAVACFKQSDIDYDVHEDVLKTGWAWWHDKYRTWVPLDTSNCGTLKEVCATALVVARMA